MYEDLKSRLEEIKQKLRQRSKLIADLQRTQQNYADQQSKLKELKTILDKEKADVDRLEGLGLASLFYAVLGDKSERLEREKQEYLTARLKYDECNYSISALQRDIDSLQMQIAGLGDIDSQNEEILAKKEQLISQQGGDKARKLLSLVEESAGLESDIKELNEAIAAGQFALSGLDSVIESLRSAKNWGTFDMIGGGLIATAVKHSRLNDAQQEINRVQHSLRSFQRELADVGSTAELSIDIGSFATFADYVFDGLIVDWMVQSRIKKSLDIALDARDRIQVVLSNLNGSLNNVKQKAEDIDQQKQRLIENA